MIEWSVVKDELNEWRDTIGDDIVDAIISNLEEEVLDEVIGGDCGARTKGIDDETDCR